MSSDFFVKKIAALWNPNWWELEVKQCFRVLHVCSKDEKDDEPIVGDNMVSQPSTLRASLN